MNAKGLMNTAKHFVKKNGSTILLVAGIGSMVGGVIAAVKGTIKAENDYYDALEEKNIGHDPDDYTMLTAGETVKACWKNYIPAAALEVAGTTCLIAGHTMDKKKQASLMAACSVAEGALMEYQSKALEVAGEKTEKKIREAIADDHIKKDPPKEEKTVYVKDSPGDGTGNYQLFRDELSKRYFYSDIQTVKKAIRSLNTLLENENHLSIQDYWEAIGLEPIPEDERGWKAFNEKDLLDVDIMPRTTPDGLKSCFVIQHYNMPVMDWNTSW